MRRSIPEEDLEEIKSSSVVTAPTTAATTSKIVPGTAAPSTSTPQPSTSSSGNKFLGLFLILKYIIIYVR